MFELGASEILLIVIVAVLVIGPKDLPLAMRTAGRWVGKIRRASNHFRAGIDAMIREAELAEMEEKWREQNKAIMKDHPAEPEPLQEPVPASAEAMGNARGATKREGRTVAESVSAEPQLPLPPP